MDMVRERELNVPIFQKQNLIKRRQFDDHSYKNRPLRKGSLLSQRAVFNENVSHYCETTRKNVTCLPLFFRSLLQ